MKSLLEFHLFKLILIRKVKGDTIFPSSIIQSNCTSFQVGASSGSTSETTIIPRPSVVWSHSSTGDPRVTNGQDPVPGSQCTSVKDSLFGIGVITESLVVRLLPSDNPSPESLGVCRNWSRDSWTWMSYYKFRSRSPPFPSLFLPSSSLSSSPPLPPFLFPLPFPYPTESGKPDDIVL